MKYKYDLEEQTQFFKPLLKEMMVEEHIRLLQKYNELIDAFNEIHSELGNTKADLSSIFASMDSINSVLRRIGLPDRIKEPYQIGTVISNALWKIANVHQTRPVPEMQIEGQPGDL